MDAEEVLIMGKGAEGEVLREAGAYLDFVDDCVEQTNEP